MPSDPAIEHFYLDIIKETLLLISESIPLPFLFINSYILRHVLWGRPTSLLTISLIVF